MEDKKPRFQHVFSAKIREPPPSVEDVIGLKLVNNDNCFDSESIKKLGDVLSIYRNKKEETFRYLFLDKDYKIVEHIGICSHSLNSCKAALQPNKNFKRFPSEDPFLDLICEHVKKNDLKIILAHNHPSGNVQESSEDIFLTSKIELKINQLGGKNKFLGHIILDHGKFNFYTPNKGWNNEYIILTNNMNINDKDPLIKKNIKPYFNYTFSSPYEITILHDIAKKLDAKENWNFKSFTPFFCVNNDNKPIAVKFIDNETIFNASQDKKAFFDLRNSLTQTAKNFGIKGFIPVVVNEKTTIPIDKIARKDIFMDVVILKDNNPVAWSISAQNTETHYPHFFSFPSIADVGFEQSKNFKKTNASKEIKKNFFYVER